MKMRSNGQRLGVMLSMIALVFGLLYGGSFTTATGAVLVSCPQGYVVSGLNCTLTTTYPLPSAGVGAWMSGTISSSVNWYDVAFGNGVFVAVASGDNSASTSPDGITWTARTLPVAGNWYSVTYANNLFVAISGGSVPAIATSPDGITWTARSISVANWKQVAYGNGVFVAIAEGENIVSTSSDGITWTARTLPSNNNWRGLAFGNGVFVAVAHSGTSSATSPDGITWTARTLSETGYWRQVAFGNGVFVAVAEASAVASTSPDGITWTTRTLPASTGWFNVAFGNGLFVTTSTSGTVAGSSPDGITWTARTMTSSQQWLALTYGADKFISIASASNVTNSMTYGSGVCTAGDTLSGSTCTNVVTIAGSTSSDYCPAGSMDDPNDKTKCIKIGGSISAGSTVQSTYSCPNGYFLLYKVGIAIPVCQNGVASYEATVTTTYSCPSGGRLVGANCYIDEINTSTSYVASVSSNISCPSGGSLIGSICYISSTLLSTVPALQTNTTTYSCPAGGTLFGTLCSIPKGRLLSTYTASATNSYNCPNGYWETLNDQCKNSAGNIVSIVITSIYWCPSGGDLSGTTCYITTNFEYNATGVTVTVYSCEDGKVLSQNGIECLRYSLSSQYPATIGSPSYSCPNGGTLAGTLCITSIISSASSYGATGVNLKSCPKGGVLSGSTCGFEVSEIAVVIVYNGSCLTYYIFNKTSLLCDPISYSYVGNTLPTLVGVYFCETYSDGNLIYTGYYGYDASSPGIIFERKCSLQTNVEGSVNDSLGYYLCEIINKVTQEVTTIILSSDITGFKDDRKTTCTFVSQNITEEDEDTTSSSTAPVTEVCDVSLSYGTYLVCIMAQNS